jgi:hypothetical protein
LRVDGESSGSGTVQVRAVSLGLPSLSESLTFSVSASPYAFEVIAETDIHVEEYGVGTFAPYRVTNTGSASDTYRMVAPVELQQAPLDWGPAVLCVEGTCYPPGWTLETTLPSGESDERYYVDWVVPGPGTGIVRLVVTSVGHPALTDTLTFTYTGTKAALR